VPEVGGGEKNERINKIYSKEITNVHRIAARNMAKREYVEQQNCWLWDGQ